MTTETLATSFDEQIRKAKIVTIDGVVVKWSYGPPQDERLTKVVNSIRDLLYVTEEIPWERVPVACCTCEMDAAYTRAQELCPTCDKTEYDCTCMEDMYPMCDKCGHVGHRCTCL